MKIFVKVFFYMRERRGHYINLQYPIRTRQIQLPSWMDARISKRDRSLSRDT